MPHQASLISNSSFNRWTGLNHLGLTGPFLRSQPSFFRSIIHNGTFSLEDNNGAVDRYIRLNLDIDIRETFFNQRNREILGGIEMKTGNMFCIANEWAYLVFLLHLNKEVTCQPWIIIPHLEISFRRFHHLHLRYKMSHLTAPTPARCPNFTQGTSIALKRDDLNVNSIMTICWHVTHTLPRGIFELKPKRLINTRLIWSPIDRLKRSCRSNYK